MFFNKNQNDNVQKNKSVKFKNAFPKIMSVVAALTLWIYVVDTQSTIEEKVISGLYVNLLNFDESDGLDIVSGEEIPFEVTVSGTKNIVEKVSQKDIIINADMSEINSPGRFMLDINISAPTGVTIVNKSSSQIPVTVDRIISKELEVEVDYQYNFLDESLYEVGEYEINPKTVTVSGTQDVVDSVAKVKVIVKDDVVDGPFSSQVKLASYDESGNEVKSSYLNYSTTSVSVDVPVSRKETMLVVPKFDDYISYSYSCEVIPEYVVIKGVPRIFESISHIATDTISVTSPEKVSVRLNLPDGATAYTLSGLPIESVDVFVTEVKEIRPEVIDASEFDEDSEETVNEEAQVSNEEINDAKE